MGQRQESYKIATKLPTLLEGEALAVWLDLSAEEKKSYAKVKETLVSRITPNTFMTIEQFRQRKLIPGEALSLFLHDLKQLLDQAMPKLDAGAKEQLVSSGTPGTGNRSTRSRFPGSPCEKFCGSIADKVTDKSQLDVIVPPILPEVSSNLDVAETAESHVANVPTSSSLSDSVQNEQAGPSHSLQVVAATSADLGIVVQAAKGCWGTLRRLPKRGGSLGATPGSLVLTVYQSPYNKALGKDGVFACHEKSLMHCHATKQADLFLLGVRNPDSRIDVRLMAQSDQQVKENKEILRQLVMAVEFLAKQALPFRGHRDHNVDFSNEDINRGNFVAILQLMAKGNSDPQIKECLVDFLHLERATATTIATKLLESLTSVSLSLNPSNIRGQAYDGAAVMSSEKAGVQAKIKEVSPLAFYIHCYCHCLNLSLASACQVQDIRNLIGTWDWDKDTLAKAQGMMAALTTFQNIAFFIITKNTLDIVQVLSVKLQKRDQDVLEAYAIVDEVMKTLESTRKTIDTGFAAWYDEILKLANEVGATESVPRITTLQRNRSNTPSISPMEHYKRTVAIPFLDYLCGQMEERFKADMKQITPIVLVPSILVATPMYPDNILDNLLKWEIDLPFPKSLPSELRRWEGLWMLLNKDKEQTIPNNLVQALSACDIDSFPNVHRLLLIGCTLPISSAEAERSFSLMKRIKTCTRSIMTEQRLSDLAIIAVHYSERIPVEEVCKAFIQEHPRRLFQAS
ncbi:hypothetical protein EMCRGX_G000003 [Ephydatia muelleri]